MKVFLKRETAPENGSIGNNGSNRNTNIIFTVKDCMGYDKYTVRSKEGSPVSKIYIEDLFGSRRLVIRRIYFPLYTLYYMTSGGERISMATSHSNPEECMFYGISWHISGNVRRKSYNIMDADNSVVAAVAKAGVGNCDAIALNILCEQRELFSIGTAVCFCMEKTSECEVFQTV